MNAVAIPDSPTRTAPLDYRGLAFGDLSPREQLDVLNRLHDRSSYWREVLVEALAESDRVPALVKAALNPVSTPAQKAALLCEILIEYAQKVADVRGDELAELV